MLEPLALLRALHFAATLAASGTVFFLALTIPPAAAVELAVLRRRLIWWIWLALGVTMASGAAWLVHLASDILGTSMAEACLQGGVWSVVAGTRFGEVWAVRGALALLLGLSMTWTGARGLQVACAVALAALPALAGHSGAPAGPAGALLAGADMLHLLAAATWLGGLPALIMVLVAGMPVGAVAAITTRFSRLGTASVAVLLASGTANAWNLLAGPGDLVTTDYGRLLALKIALFAAMVAIAAVNRFHVTPRLAHPPAAQALRRNSLAETALGLGVIVLVGALGTVPPDGHKHANETTVPDGAAFVHLHANEVMVEVTLETGRASMTHATIRVMHEDSSQFPARQVDLELAPPAPGLTKIARAALRSADGTWRVENIELWQPGVWTTRVTVTPSAGAPMILDGPIVIDPHP